jgi:hypothetical protein
MEAVRPIHMPGTAALASLRERAHAALSDWALEWASGWPSGGNPMATFRVCSVTGAGQAYDYEYDAVGGDAGCVWFRRAGADLTELGCTVVGPQLMPGSVSVDDWIADVVDQARDARNRALVTALLGAAIGERSPVRVSELPGRLFAVGSGAVELSCDLLGLYAIADGAVWRTVPPTERERLRSLPKLTPLNAAVRRANARLDVILGSVEVDLPKLLDLRCGDVLRLPQRLDRGITVLCEGKPLGRAALAQLQGRKCVQLLPNHQ